MSLNSKSRAENRRGRWAEPYTRPDTSLLGDLSVPLFEPVHSTRRIDKTLLAGVERVAGGADGYFKLRLGRAGYPMVAAGAFDLGGGVVSWMNIGLHNQRIVAGF